MIESKTISKFKEYEIAKKLDSPFLVTLIRDYFYYKESFCFLMEFCEVKILKKIDSKMFYI